VKSLVYSKDIEGSSFFWLLFDLFLSVYKVLCNTGDTQEVVAYRFFEFVLHKKTICRLNQQVELKANGYPVLVLNVFM